MGLSSSCSNRLAMLISFGDLLLDFAMVSECVAVSQYTAHVAEGLDHLLASRVFRNFFRRGLPPCFHFMVCLSFQTVVKKL
jgi:hypothetical protein